MAAGVGKALGAIGLVAGIKGAFDTYRFLDDLFRHDDDAHSLVLGYRTTNVCLQRWLEKLDEMIAAGNDPVSPLSAEVKKLVVGHLTEIDRCAREIEECLEAQGLNDLPAYGSLVDGQSMRFYVVSEMDKENVARTNLDKLDQSVNSLQVILPIDNTNAIAAILLPQLRSIKDLSIVASSRATYGHLASSAAKLALSEMNPPRVFTEPRIEPSSIILDEENAKGPRSMGFLDGQRVLIEWKRISRGLEDEQRDKVIRRIEALGALLCQPKEQEFRVPHCLGIYNSTLLNKGYIYRLPSSESEKLGYYSLADRLDLNGRDGKSKKKPATIPLLGDRFKLAYRLAKAFNLLHPAMWLHKDFRSCNVIFFDKSGSQPDSETINVDEMYIVGFQYSRLGIAGEVSIETIPQSEDISVSIYRHPDLNKGSSYHKLYELYSLGVVLFEIALWEPLHMRGGVREHGADGEARRKWLIKAADVALGGVVGEKYRDVVKACLTGNFGPNIDVDGDLDRAVLFNVVDRLSECKA
ncbi:hypothetical protein NA56DRAFT_651857 [Hyaloscypha hepaticicola]|uniref:Protein kinase domain-containing protein n=1 Tax=Hyaloscypha hepaticicola TaxID=2082293 RepID=A0A2J6PGW9_9HELO|nr:hypothetical protein NA56DRAFT_651857 [Hyaloscypha hepaticicola]